MATGQKGDSKMVTAKQRHNSKRDNNKSKTT